MLLFSKVQFHFWLLLLVLILGAGLRLMNLDGKALWMDEVITALFSLGRNYSDLPLERAVSLETIAQVFTLRPAASCAEIAETVRVQSVHPPLFFCWMHSWLGMLQSWPLDLRWRLRSLPACFGIGEILAIYALTRIAFGKRAGLFAAGLMAVSPFAVYLSQEARHYTLPMLLITLSLIALLQIHQAQAQGRSTGRAWMSWVLLNGIGFYVHYFCLLATVAQVGAIGVSHLQDIKKLPGGAIELKRRLRSLGIALAALIAFYAPWLPTFIGHMTRPETDWVDSAPHAWFSEIAPLYQLPMGWILMVVAPPFETASIGWQIFLGLLLLGFIGWLVRQIWQGLGTLLAHPEVQDSTRLLGRFVGIVVLEFLGIFILLHKDLTQVPRYNFIYYPGVCTLLAAIFVVQAPVWRRRSQLASDPPLGNHRLGLAQLRSPVAIVLLAGFLSSCCVTANLVIQKPYHPDRVAQDLQPSSPEESTLVVMGYQNFQDIALGSGFALALDRTPAAPHTQFAFLKEQSNQPSFWSALGHFPGADQLWVIAPGFRRVDFPSSLALDRSTCTLDPTRYHRLGVPYQRYRCSAS